MTVSRTNDLHFASWLADWESPQFAGGLFAQHRKITEQNTEHDAGQSTAHDPDDGSEDMSPDVLAALIGCLRSVTPPYLAVEVTYGEWTGRPGFWGRPTDTNLPPTDAGGRLTRMSVWAVGKGVRITAFGSRQRALTRQWWDQLLHTPLSFQGRDYALFRGPLDAVTQWESPLGRLPFRHSPDLIWPDDHSWLVMTSPEGGTDIWGDDRLAAALDADPVLGDVLR
jgi:hypothetical protein